MTRKKTQKKEAFRSLPNCTKENTEFRGKWREKYDNDHPIHLEIGCGKGEVSLGLARMYPDSNYMGIDLKSDRLYVGASRAIEDKLENVIFHRLDASGLSDYFGEKEISGIWVTFPDPFPRKRHAKRRLTHYRFLLEYQKVLKKDGIVQFKTDNKELFLWSMRHLKDAGAHIIEHSEDLHHSKVNNEERGIITTYEQRFMDMGVSINFVSFTLPDELVEPAEEETLNPEA